MAARLALVSCAGVALVLFIRWPFTEQRVIAGLQRATGSDVQVVRFRKDFLPRPGCTIENVTVSRASAQPIARAQKLIIRTSWWTLLSFKKRVSHLRIEQLNVLIPVNLPPSPHPADSDSLWGTAVDEVMADGATLEFASDEPAGKPLRFAFQRLRLTEFGADRESGFSMVVANPHPPGELKTSGTFGPVRRLEQGRTPIAGSFELNAGSLSQYPGLRGTLNGKGEFRGVLDSIAIQGAASVPDFAVNNGHSVGLRADYRAAVNGLSGDVLLESVEADFLETHLSVAGAIHTKAGEREKTVSLDFAGEQARIQDLLKLFTKAGEPALNGPIALRAHVELPPGDEAFLRRLRLDGVFGIDDARWTRARTQTKIDELSARARGDKKQLKDGGAQLERVVSDLKGTVSMRNGVAALSGVSFRVPGATATGGGTFDVIRKQLDLRGTVSMTADASQAASGIKSILLKPFDRLFRRDKKQKGATLPVSIVGEYPRPRYRVGLKR
jgi:hypothetical protein